MGAIIFPLPNFQPPLGSSPNHSEHKILPNLDFYQGYKAQQNHIGIPSYLMKICLDCLNQDVPPYWLAHVSSSTLDFTTHRALVVLQTLPQARARITRQSMGLRYLPTSNTDSIRKLGCTDYGSEPQSH